MLVVPVLLARKYISAFGTLKRESLPATKLEANSRPVVWHEGRLCFG